MKIHWVASFTKEQLDTLKSEIEKRVYGQVEIDSTVVGYVGVRVRTKDFTFGYSVDYDTLTRCNDIDRIVYDFMWHFKEKIMERYIKKEGTE